MAEAKLAAGEAAESSFLAGASDGKHAKIVKAKKKTARNKKEEHDFEDDSTKLAAGDAAETSSLVAADGRMRKISRLRRLLAKMKEEHDFEEDSTVVGAVADEASIEDDDDSLRKSTEKVLPKLRTRTGRPDLDSSTFGSSAKASHLRARLASLAGVSPKRQKIWKTSIAAASLIIYELALLLRIFMERFTADNTTIFGNR